VPAPIVAMGMVTWEVKTAGPIPNNSVGVIVVIPLGWTINCDTGVPLMVTPDGSILI